MDGGWEGGREAVRGRGGWSAIAPGRKKNKEEEEKKKKKENKEIKTK